MAKRVRRANAALHCSDGLPDRLYIISRQRTWCLLDATNRIDGAGETLASNWGRNVVWRVQGYRGERIRQVFNVGGMERSKDLQTAWSNVIGLGMRETIRRVSLSLQS